MFKIIDGVLMEYTEEEKAIIRRKKEIKTRLSQLAEDFMQAYVGAKIHDIDARVKEFQELHNELRVLEGKAVRVYGN